MAWKYAVDLIERGEATNNLIFHSRLPYDTYIYTTKEYPNDAGGYYPEEYLIWKVKLPNGELKYFQDRSYNAPWQVGGNSGHIRDLKPLTEDEAIEICRTEAESPKECIDFIKNKKTIFHKSL